MDVTTTILRRALGGLILAAAPAAVAADGGLGPGAGLDDLVRMAIERSP